MVITHGISGHIRSFTNDLYRLADWLIECGIETVVMEATGVYWMWREGLGQQNQTGGESCGDSLADGRQ